jgi:moderate conductance mechanosensitive channel
MALADLPVVLALDLLDRRPDWTEIVLAVCLALVGAAIATRIINRILTWASHGAIGAHVPEAYRRAARRPLMLVRLLVFFLGWIVLALPLLDAIGVPLELGTTPRVLRDWLLASGMRVVIILAVAWLVMRVVTVASERIERELSQGEGLDVLERTKRAQTLGRLIHNVLAIVITSIALMMVLRELGLDIVPMLTGAGIVGVALGFGAQYLVRDVIAGFFLILENQVRVGDVVAVNGVGGVVEAVNLRTILLRDGEGTVHVFQNGAINMLANRTKDFSYYVIDLNVPYDQDVDRVTAVLRDVGRELENDPAYRDSILAPLEVFGVDAFLDTKMTIKLRIKTVPLKQWDVGRELRRRIKRALEEHNLPLTPSTVPLLVARRGAKDRTTPQAAGGDAPQPTKP